MRQLGATGLNAILFDKILDKRYVYIEPARISSVYINLT